MDVKPHGIGPSRHAGIVRGRSQPVLTVKPQPIHGKREATLVDQSETAGIAIMGEPHADHLRQLLALDGDLCRAGDDLLLEPLFEPVPASEFAGGRVVDDKRRMRSGHPRGSPPRIGGTAIHDELLRADGKFE